MLSSLSTMRANDTFTTEQAVAIANEHKLDAFVRAFVNNMVEQKLLD